MTTGTAPGIARRRGTAGILLLAACFGLCGCLGTIATRDRYYGSREPRERYAGTRPPKDHAPFGAVPFSGVAFDAVFVVTGTKKLRPVCPLQPAQAGEVFLVRVLAILSLPLDALIDAIALPYDLVGWAFGYRKTWPFDEGRARESSTPKER